MAADRQAQKDNTNSKGTGRSRHTATDASRPLALHVVSLPPNGKVAISHLVDEGLLIPGNTVACNNWPFRATVTAQGKFEAQWEPLPADFIPPYGTEFMRSVFETPSAWATAVCRIMRAQAKAPLQKNMRNTVHADATEQGEAALGSRSKGQRAKSAKTTASTGASGESRVAVNGWTACRVLVPSEDPNRGLAERLDSFDDAVNANVSASSDVIEIPLDALRQELYARINRMRVATKKRTSDTADQSKDYTVKARGDAQDEGDSDSDDHGSPGKIEMAELPGAVDGLAQRVESDLALGCVKQRRAAAAAADAISAASSSTITEQQLALSRKEMHSRKRKSIPDMSRHSKLSRIPSENTNGDGSGDQKHTSRQQQRDVDSDETSSDDETGRLDVQTRAVLAYFQDRAQTLKRIHTDLRTLRYRRRQRLKRTIVTALDTWERQRRRQRQQRQTPKGMCLPEDAASPSAMVEVPLESGVPVRVCVRCGTTGEMQRCGGCGDTYHWFCADSSTGDRFVCAACRVCTRCLDDAPHDTLVQCRTCGQHMHTQCSEQQSVAASNDGQWVCDDCVECLECGLRMPTHDSTSAVEWAHDYCMCGGCARQIERARVCPECVATYGSRSVGTSMVCCDICSFWVHTECDVRLTPDVYDALITLEDAPYVCPMCTRTNGALLPDIDGSSASELDDDDLDDAAVAAIPALPRCLRPLVTQYSSSVSESEIEVDTDAAIATLLASQATLASPAAPEPKPEIKTSVETKPEADTAEAANLLLSLTRSDVRFGRDRFDVEALEARYCVAHPKRLAGSTTNLADWRQCALCGLRGDGLPAPKNDAKSPSLGRLVPLATVDQSAAATRWAHVECLAWSWGPRPMVTATSTPVAAASRSPPMLPSAPLSPSPTGFFGSDAPMVPPPLPLPLPLVHFQGALLLDSKDDAKGLSCTLCGRLGASFHCCAPVACFDTAYHLPCLLLAGTPSPPHLPHSEQQPQYCAGWRRALCATHAPEFSAMMPADGAVPSTSYDSVRVTATIDNMPPANLRPSVTRIGNLFVFAWGRHPDPLGPELHCLRFFELNGAPHSLCLRCTAPNAWAGWIAPGFPALSSALSQPNAVSSEHSLPTLLRSLFDRILVADSADSAAIDAAVRYPLKFLGLDRLSLALPGYLSPIPRPAKD
ncbi:Histone-lysine N-methyltransferase 2A [Coemansia sp. RSA 1646]|nr:Histone-lysine N-methyltransferase 2A [Coemansia sp. RSA 1646]KAJ2086122.1 Histone-lysine N-methyltransferase [Coemansia sp. RSA 986]